MKKVMLLAAITGALTVPATAAASNGIGAGGVAACAAAFDVKAGAIAPVTQITVYPGPPGPMAGPNSVIDWSLVGAKNNGTGLIGFCQAQ